MALDQVPEAFAHLTVDSTPQTSSEAFWMASQWGTRWSHWNRYAQLENGTQLCAQADGFEVQKLVSIGAGLAIKEAVGDLVDVLHDGLDGSEIGKGLGT